MLKTRVYYQLHLNTANWSMCVSLSAINYQKRTLNPKRAMCMSLLDAGQMRSHTVIMRFRHSVPLFWEERGVKGEDSGSLPALPFKTATGNAVLTPETTEHVHLFSHNAFHLFSSGCRMCVRNKFCICMKRIEEEEEEQESGASGPGVCIDPTCRAASPSLCPSLHSPDDTACTHS